MKRRAVAAEAGLSQPSLADAKGIVAREYGHSSWQKLQTHITDDGTQRQNARPFVGRVPDLHEP